MSPAGRPPVSLHASAVAVRDRGLLITGKAGAGKTTLTLEMMALGAALIADDQTLLAPDDDGPGWLSAPAPLTGLIEIRGAGVLQTDSAAKAPLFLIADLDEAPSERMPPRPSRELAGRRYPVILCRDRPGLAATLMAILKVGHLPDPEATA